MSIPTGPARKLQLIMPVEGILPKVPQGLFDDMRRQLLAGGEEDFAMELWPDNQTVSKDDEKRAQFVHFPSGDRLPASRFTYGTRSQIIVVKYPATAQAQAHSVIIIPVKPFKLIEDVPNNRGWYASAWEIWQPAAMRHVKATNGVQIVRAIEQSPKLRNSLNFGREIASRTPSSYKLDPRSSSIDSTRRFSTTSGISTDIDQHRTAKSVLKRELDYDKDEIDAQADFVPLQKQRKLTASSIASTRASSEADTVTVRRPSVLAPTPLTPSSPTSRPSSTLAPSRRTSINKADTSNMVRFIFRGEDGTKKGESSLTDCITASDLFDEACSAGIVDKDTRMLSVMINGGEEIKLRANKEEHFQSKLLEPLTRMMEDTPGSAVCVVVANYY